MPQPLIIPSQTGGLWIRYIIRFVFFWVAMTINFACMAWVVLSGLDWYVPPLKVIVLGSCLFAFAYVAFFRYYDNPWYWNNTVRFDKEQLKITVTPQRKVSGDGNYSDNEDIQIPFEHISYIKTDVYETFLNSAYYRFKVKTRGQTIRLFVIHQPDEYLAILEKIKGEMGIAVV